MEVNKNVKEEELFEAGEMEMELDGEEITNDMEEIVADKVKQEEKNKKEQASKRGPKPLTEEEKAAKKVEKGEEPKKEKALNLKDQNIVQREIKKGRISAPCFRIEKTEKDGSYDLLMAAGLIFAEDAKKNYKKYSNVQKMVDGKVEVTLKAASELRADKFTAQHVNGEEVVHDWVRVELHKPGREKDVVELYSVKAMKDVAKRTEAIVKKKEEEAKKKAEKEAKEKEKAEQDAKKETKKEESTKA